MKENSDSRKAKPDSGIAGTGTASGVTRRTIVQGAAWSVPVVALSVATPLAAASALVPTLAFINGPYASASCATLNDVALQLTTDGTTPDPGKPVSVTLPDGYTWSDGTTAAKSFITDANGQVILNGIVVPAGPSTGGFTATSGSLTDAAPATVSTLPVAKYLTPDDGLVRTYANVPPGSTVQRGSMTFIAPNGDLYYGNTKIATGGVTNAMSEVWGDNESWVYFVQNGIASRYDPRTGDTVTWPSVPANSTVVGSQTYLASDGSLWYGSVNIVESGVTSASGEVWGDDTYYVYYTWNGQAWYWNRLTQQHQPYTGVPANSVVQPGSAIWLAPDGSLWHGNDNIARGGVTAASGEVWNNDINYVYYIWNGQEWYYRASDKNQAQVTVPANSELQTGSWTVIAPNGDLYVGGKNIASNVSSASSEVWGSDRHWVYWMEEPAC